MNTFNVNTKSWHFWLAKQSDSSLKWRNQLDICSYTRKVIAGFLVTILLTSIGSFLAACIGYGLVGWFNTAVFGKWPDSHSFQFGMMVAVCIVTAAAILVVGVCYMAEQHDKWSRRRDLRELHNHAYPKTPAEPGALSKMWKHFKEKTCVRVEFKS